MGSFTGEEWHWRSCFIAQGGRWPEILEMEESWIVKMVDSGGKKELSGDLEKGGHDIETMSS